MVCCGLVKSSLLYHCNIVMIMLANVLDCCYVLQETLVKLTGLIFGLFLTPALDGKTE